MWSRTNQSRKAVYSTEVPIEEGSFKVVYSGTYTQGPRKNQACVVKVMRSGSTYLASAFDHDMKIVDRAQLLLDKFNDAKVVDKRIYLNQPEVWERVPDGQKIMVEPFIANFEKFNSNSGWVSNEHKHWVEVAQALSHFSYHTSGGQFVLCDIQGGVYRKSMVLTDPVILSRARSYGPTDLGPDGITTFFARHQCNRYCSPYWQQPRYVQELIPECSGTSMMMRNGRMAAPTRRGAAVPTRHSRPLDTRGHLDSLLEGDSEYYDNSSDPEAEDFCF